MICADSIHNGYYFVEFSDKSVSKSDFIKIINLHHMYARKSIQFLTDQKVFCVQKSLFSDKLVIWKWIDLVPYGKQNF